MPLSDRHRQLIDQAKAAQRSRQLARAQPQPVPNQIGDRDPVTGQHAAIYPDGSQTTQGRKLYDAHASKGDSVTGLPVGDGTIGLLGPKGQASPLAPPAKEGIRGLATPGPLKTNEVGYLRGQVWSYEEPEKAATANIKYLFTTTDSEFTYLYIGGHQPQATLVTQIPIGQPIAAVKLDNLRGKGYQVSLAIQDGVGTQLVFATTGYNVISTFKTLVSFIRPVGAGFWVTAATDPFLPNYLGATSVGDYYSFVTDQTGNPELNNKVDSFYRDRVLASAFSRASASTGQSAFSGALYVLPDLQVVQTKNDIIQFRDFYSVERVDAKGLHGYAVHYDSIFSVAPSWLAQAIGVVQYPAQTDIFAAIDSSYIDVFPSKFSLVKRTDIDIQTNKTIAVALYRSTFKATTTKRVKVFKQSISPDAQLQDVSYSN